MMAVYGLWSAVCGLKTADGRRKTADFYEVNQ